MAGRPITNNTPQAQYKREWMRKQRAGASPHKYNPAPLIDALKNWKLQ